MEQRISKLSLDKGNKLKEGHGGLPREKGVLCMWKKKKKKKLNGWKRLVIMCEEVFMEKSCAKMKRGRKLCVASTYSEASRFLF